MNSEEGGEEEEEEEEEEFFESLDRILSSSSCSSASSSDDDGDRQNFFLHRRHSQNRGSRPNSPWTYDFWISEPSSVEDRRRNLLQQLGLVGDSFLSRREQMNLDDRNSDGGEDQTTRDNGREDSSSSAMARSRFQDCHSSANFRTLHPSPTNPTGSESATSGSKNNDDPQEQQNTQRDLYCTIKNLDSGEEFVVKELQEDGMWKKLREVGTGRQLTMEEFQSSVVGHSPIVQELMRRQNVEDAAAAGKPAGDYRRNSDLDINELRSKKKGSGWLKSIKIVAGTVVHRIEKRSSDERDTSSEKGGRRSSSATDDSQDAQSHHSPERVKVRHYGKTWKELTDLFLSQEIRAHSGSIWSMKFSLDGRFLASAGEDCIIRIWQVIEIEKKGDLLTAQSGEDGCLNLSHESPETMFLKSNSEGSSCSMNKKRRPKVASGRKSVSFDQIVLPENVFTLSEKPVCSFRGHLQDVLDLSWSKSEHLLSSSMDKTVRLWHISSSSCLKIFSHSDYVTCIQFNPVDDDYFISGSLDAKVRLWSIRGRQVVDWKDVHEMVTAACYTPDGQGALVGSHKGGCHVYDASDNKLHLRAEVDLKNKKKRSHHKITGFQFVPGSSSEVLITSADSRIRVVDGLSLVHKFKGFLNTSSQISASLTSDGKHVVSASEDSHVYIWRYDRSTKGKGGGIATTQSYELFHCRDVSAAVAWPGGAAGSTDATSVWGMVIVTACRGGEIRVFQNFGSPIRV